jgi:hypothetical protein
VSLFSDETYDDFFDFDMLSEAIKNRLKLHHQVYDSRCKDVYLEENFHKALLSLNIANVWKSGSHNVKFDIVTNGPDIGIKSGKIDFKLNLLEYSGSRLGSHDTIEKKIQFLEKNKPHYTFFMAQKENCNSYFFCVLKNSVITYKLDWKQNGKKFIAESEKYRFEIRESMSSQLWTEIDLDLFSYIKEIVV